MSILQSLRANFSPAAIASSVYNFGEKSIVFLQDYWDSSTDETKTSLKKAAAVAGCPALALVFATAVFDGTCVAISPFIDTEVNLGVPNSTVIGSMCALHLGIGFYILALKGATHLLAEPQLPVAPHGPLQVAFHPVQGLPQEIHPEVLDVAHEGA